MSLTGVVISDFSQAVIEQDRICSYYSVDKWEVVSYETDVVSGKMINASEETLPPPVTVKPSLTGWHRIYVCMADYEGGGFSNHIRLKLSRDLDYTSMRAGNMRPFVKWNILEQVQETLWTVADLTGQDVIIEKIDNQIPHTANLLWLRFEPITDEEAEEYRVKCNDLKRKTMFAHMDGDFPMYGKWEKPEDFLHPLYAFKDSDVGILSQEIMNDDVDFNKVDPKTYPSRKAWSHTRAFYLKRFHEMRHEIYRKELEYAHKNGIKMIAAQRMALSNFSFPHNQPIFDLPFVTEHPELRCVQRDGSYCEFLSYGHKEVQDYAISTLLSALEDGFDGVELIFSRGILTLFEKPIKDKFIEKYGNETPVERIPETDSRLREVRCSIMTDFVGRLRAEMDKFAKKNNREHLIIYITTPYTYESGLNLGVDVKALAANGLIDGVVQTKMSIWEDVSDVLADDGLINLEKYIKKARTEYVVLRKFGDDMELMASAIPQYREILKSTNVLLYSELQWENGKRPEVYAETAQKLYEAGTDSIALWDCYPSRVQNRGEWNAVKHLGVKDETLSLTPKPSNYYTVHKVLSYNGLDMRYYLASWRG